jgi:hypothetical protein
MSNFDDRIRRDLAERASRFQPSTDLDSRIDDAITRWQHRARVATVTATAVATVVLLLVLAAVVVLPGRDSGEKTRTASRLASSTTATSTSRPPSEGAVVVPPSGATPAPPSGVRPAPRSERPDLPDRSSAATGTAPSTAPPADATPPAITAISITDPDTEGVCTASWTTDDGGTPIKEYVVSKETPVVPPDTPTVVPDPADPTTAPPGTDETTTTVDETKDAFTDAPIGSSLTVTARNAVGTSEPTEEVVCGS